MQSTGTRKKPHCRSCGSPMEGHKRKECSGTFLKTPSPSPSKPSSLVSPFRNNSPRVEGQDRKPIILTKRLPALFDDGQERDFDFPIPMASIYAAADVSPSEIQRTCEDSKGKYHSGIFYTPTTRQNKGENEHSLNKYKGWVIVGQDANVVRQVVRGGGVPGAFVTTVMRNGMEVVGEIVEGPRMVTVLHLVFLAFITVVVTLYWLSRM
ncbi:hypothetical protein BT96DRAFT_914794 [Gymnopus androsaceus JB14]|uniref:Uncharacterized protein n=1 Tax=Gymnopus androsaceus JB14 TaxID=1447944 RepID=A0A6A4IEW6_9AGAR|nr:hypothetical protein BT96DRAFT_914794 [Gymnopus androsaceus JB14]